MSKYILEILGALDWIIALILLTLAIYFVLEKDVFFFLLSLIAFAAWQISCTLGVISEQLTQAKETERT